MTTIACTVGREEDGLTLHDELSRAFGVAALREVHHLARAIRLDHSAVGMLPATMTDVSGEDPLAVGTPMEVDIPIGIGVVELLVEDLVVTPRLELVDVDPCAVTQVSHLRAVGREEGLEGSLLVIGQLRLLDITCIDEERIIRARQLRHIDIPPTVALSGIDELLAIGAEVDITFFFGRTRETLGRTVFAVRDEDIAVDDEGNFLVIGSYGEGSDAITDGLGLDRSLFLVTDDVDLHLRRLSARGLRIDLPIEAVTERAIRSNGEEADGVLREGSNLLVRSRGRSSITVVDVEGAFTFAQIVEASLAVPDCVAVFTAKRGQLGVLSLLGVQPDVARHGRDSVLTPNIFVALDIGVKQFATT